MTTAAERLVRLAGTTGAALVDYSGQSGISAGQHLLASEAQPQPEPGFGGRAMPPLKVLPIEEDEALLFAVLLA